MRLSSTSCMSASSINCMPIVLPLWMIVVIIGVLPSRITFGRPGVFKRISFTAQRPWPSAVRSRSCETIPATDSESVVRICACSSAGKAASNRLFVLRAPSGAVGGAQRGLRDDPGHRFGERGADLCLLVGGEGVDQSIDRIRRSVGVQRAEDQRPHLSGGDRQRDRLQGARFAGREEGAAPPDGAARGGG